MKTVVLSEDTKVCPLAAEMELSWETKLAHKTVYMRVQQLVSLKVEKSVFPWVARKVV